MKKLPKLKTVRNKCDALLTPIVKLLRPNCLLCGHPTEVAHHHIHKSQSTRLRYETENLINLCTPCHLKLHYNESMWASRIVEIKGIKWFQDIDRLGREIVKADVHYFIAQFKRLDELYNSLNGT